MAIEKGETNAILQLAESYKSTNDYKNMIKYYLLANNKGIDVSNILEQYIDDLKNNDINQICYSLMDKIVLNQSLSNEEHTKIMAQLENQCKNCKQYINNNKCALIPCGHTKFCNLCINILTRTKKCLQCGAHVDNILELH
jgi:hypothetical protein